KYQKINKKKYINFCEIVSILLDNAIEASMNTKNKSMYLNIVNKKNQIEIVLLNSFNNKVDLNKIGDKFYSTKKRKSGLGLYYIEKLDKDITVKKSFILDLFKIEVVIKK
ncbi:MAG: GHKL domain-containing protein, partial [Bacilli bacterium]|nr:GHKL domain-containing protein [Bacilli bacterium]